jgi:hypothetical protein
MKDEKFVFISCALVVRNLCLDRHRLFYIRVIRAIRG